MLLPVEWLKEYTNVDVELDVFCEKMIMSGSNIETVEELGTGMEKVVVGKILSLEKHPDAEKLQICRMDVGQERPLQIVTGATNVFEGAYVPVILDGGRLPGGKTIEKGMLRGVESMGMLCSAKELGYEDKVVPVAHKDGIWILEGDYSLGQNLVEALNLTDQVVDFEITPNRPDCLSIIGMARETAATLGGTLHYPDTLCTNEVGDVKEYISLEIKKPELCKRYAARVAKDVKVGPSPWWLQKRLMHAGMRPINNIVDITNYVMLEYGQPIHAFDIRTLKGSSIIVDTAEDGEIFTTLDGTERKLDKDMLLIKDGERGVAIAGVMGGLNSEIEADTTTILIESANFAGDSVRRTSKRLGLRTEASSRFEKGIDPNLAGAAADRVCKLIEMLGAGTVVAGTADCYPFPEEAPTVPVRAGRVNLILGTALSVENMADIFRRLEMDARILEDGDTILVTPPTVRQDLITEVDFVEEVARIYGYDKMPSTLTGGNNRSGKSAKRQLRDLAVDSLTGLGYNEIQTYSFVSPRGLDDIQVPEGRRERNVIRLINPLGEENGIMRTMLTPNMLEVLGRNFSRNIPAVRAFEVGNTFLNEIKEDNLPTEEEAVVIGCYGPAETFFTLKGVVEELLRKLGIKNVSFSAEGSDPTYHPGRCATITAGETRLGIIGEVHPDVLEQYGIGMKGYCCEMNFDRIGSLADRTVLYTPLPRYPSTSRDIALLLDEDVPASEVEERIWQKGGELLESVALFDVYRGKQVPEGKKSAAFTLTYRRSDRTLTDEEVTPVHQKILEELKEKLNAVLRDM